MKPPPPSRGSAERPAEVTPQNAAAWNWIAARAPKPRKANARRDCTPLHVKGCYVCAGPVVGRRYHPTAVGDIHEQCLTRILRQIMEAAINA